MEVGGGISVKNISITTTGVSRATATVTLDVDGDTVTDAACGNGPVDAVFKAVELMVGEHVLLEDFSLKSVSRAASPWATPLLRSAAATAGWWWGGASAPISSKPGARAYVKRPGQGEDVEYFLSLPFTGGANLI